MAHNAGLRIQGCAAYRSYLKAGSIMLACGCRRDEGTGGQPYSNMGQTPSPAKRTTLNAIQVPIGGLTFFSKTPPNMSCATG